MKLQGRIALITGAAKRIGREIALTLAERGAEIILHYRESRAEAKKLQVEIESRGGTAYLVDADFSPSKKPLEPVIRNFAKKVYSIVPRVDILVNNAAIFYPTPFGKITEKDWDDFMTVNLKAPFFLAQEFGQRMLKEKSGKIVNLVDWTGQRPMFHYLPYSIAKAGLEAATKGLAKVLGPNIQVIGVAPGPILPPKGMKKPQMKKTADRTLLKKFGDPSDIAQAVRFVIEDTDFITGSVIYVDGGALAA